MRKLLILLTLLSLPVVPIVAHADTITIGPITIGTDSPLYIEPVFSQGTYTDGTPYYHLYANLPIVGLNSPVGSEFVSGSVSFSYDLAPGWTAEETLYDSVDIGTSLPYDDLNFAAAFFQELILCPSTAVSPCTSGALVQQDYGRAPLPPGMTPNAIAEPGTGIYQYAEYADYADFGSVNPVYVNIYVTPSIPEPSTFVLLGTGAIGLLGMAKRRLALSHS